MGFKGQLFLALALFVFANGDAQRIPNFFEARKTYTYAVSSRVKIGDEGTPVEFSNTLEITPISANTFRFKNKKFEVTSDPSLVIPQPLIDQLESPVDLMLSNDGQFLGIRLYSEQMENWIINLKKSQAAKFLLNFPPRPRHQHSKMNEVRGGPQMEKEWKVEEATIFGNCEVSYKMEERTEAELGLSSESSESSSEESLQENMVRNHCHKGSNFYVVRKKISSMKCIGVEPSLFFTSSHNDLKLNYEFILCGTSLKDSTILKMSSTEKAANVGKFEEKFILQQKRRESHQLTNSLNAYKTHTDLKITHKSYKKFEDTMGERNQQTSRDRLAFSLPSLNKYKEWLKEHMARILAQFGITIHGPVRDLDPRVTKFRSCLEAKTIPSNILVDPVTNSSGYQFLNFQWNSAFKKVFPVAFLLPTETRHVAAAVKCGVITGIHLVANSGGHSYDHISWGNNSTLIIDFQEMNKVELEGRGKGAIAKLQPGALLGPATAKLWELGKVGIPVGNCLTVGVGGHALGGGIGLFSMVYGLLIDNVLEYEIVDAKGDVKRASASENADLFWALRGIGPGYIGIVTELRIRTFQADKIQLSVVKLVYSVKDFVKVAEATQDWIEWSRNNDPKVGTIAMAYSDDWNATNSVTPGGSEPGIIVAAVHIYDPDINPQSNSTFLRKIIEMMPEPQKKMIFFPPYLALHFATGYSPVVFPNQQMPTPTMVSQSPSPFPPDEYLIALFKRMTKPLALPRYFKAKSQFVKRRITRPELEKMGEIMQSIPANRAGLLISTEHGAIKDVSADAAAYVHRDVAIDFRVHVEATPRDGDINEAIVWMDKFWKAMQSFDGKQTYQNYPDIEIPDFLVRYYGKNLPKLVQTKEKWDPTNYFVNDQSLPLILDQSTFTDRKLKEFRACLESVYKIPTTHLVDRATNAERYDVLNLQWNTRIATVYPVAYFLPKETKDVQAAVKCGVKSDLHLIPNSGGHSYEAISWGTNETVVVDFREMTKVEMIENGAVAYVQPGALVGPVNAQLWLQGKKAIPMGNCLTVGLGGHAVGGGIGFYTAMYGLTIDRMIEYELVDAKGEIVIANKEKNPELFWTLRGVAAGYVGIATGFKVKPFNAGNMQISVAKIVYPVKMFAKVGQALQDWIKWTSENDPSIFSTFTITNDDWTSNYPATASGPVGGILLSTLHIYDPEVPGSKGNATFLAKLDEIFPSGHKIKDISYPNYIEFVLGSGYAPVRMNVTVADRRGRSSSSSQTYSSKIVEIGNLDDPILDSALEFQVKNSYSMDNQRPAASPVSIPQRAIPEELIIKKLMSMKKEIAMPRYFNAKSLFVKRKLTTQEFEKLGEILLRIPNNKNWVLLSSEMGAVWDKKYDDTAYVHRDSVIDISVHVEVTATEGDVREADAWMREFWDAMQSFDGGETYQNYPDLEVVNWKERYYGKNLPRLVKSKKDWDPQNYFRNPISLPTTM